MTPVSPSATGTSGVGRLHEEERRLAAGVAHLLRVFGIVAADAVDAVHGEFAAAGAGHGDGGGRREDEAHGGLRRGAGEPCMPRPARRYTAAHVPAPPHQALPGLRRRRPTYRVPADDNRERAICTACGEIHYENPINVVGTLPVWGDQVLLCRRNIEPRYGFWTLPAGFLELGESTAEGALRETDEEAGARIELQGLFTVLNVVRVGQVHLFYRARMLDTSAGARARDHRGAAVPRRRGALGPDRLSHRAADAGALLRRPSHGGTFPVHADDIA